MLAYKNLVLAPLGNGSIGSSSIEKVIVEFPAITMKIVRSQKWLLNSYIL